MTADEAQRLMDRHARSFAPAVRLLSRRDRTRVARLYALCRIVDDLADDATDAGAAAARLRRIEADIASAAAPRDPVACAAVALFADRPAGLQAFARLVAGVRRDLGVVRVADGHELRDYCSAVAGTVGVMVCGLFDIDPRHHAAADALGRAMQLTNICRDVRADARLGRRYLPATLCDRTPSEILAGPNDAVDDVRKATAHLLGEAEALYDVGLAALGALPVRLRLAVAVAATLYRGIGRRLHDRGCDPLAGRVRVPRLHQAGLAVTALPAALRPPPARTRSGAANA